MAAAVTVVLAAVVIVVATGMRPEYDGYGWLVWGREALHWSLDTNGAPSWKPLPFLFTVPYALFGRAQLWLWMVTAVTAGLAAAALAARIAYRLTGPDRVRPWAPMVAGAFAAVGILGMSGWWHYMLIANSDPMIEALFLGAIDCHLSRRFRLAFGLLALAGLGRPEVWPFVVLYAAWVWRVERRQLPWLLAGLGAIAALWFGIPALTAKSVLISGQLAEGSANALRGAKIPGVVDRFLDLSPLPIELAALAGLGFAVVRRERMTLVLAGTALLWVCIEIAFALHGWSAVSRYLFPAAAVMAVIAGTGAGRLLATWPRPERLPAVVSRWAGPAVVLALAVTLLPSIRTTARFVHGEISDGHRFSRQVNRLADVIARRGGAAHIKRCGQPVSALEFQSVLAWEVELNVGDVGWRPQTEIRSGRPIVLFEPKGLGWRVRPLHVHDATCDALRAGTPVA